MTWHLWLDSAHPGAVNMARDEALLELAESEGAALLRFYQWEPGALSFGAHEPALKRYDRDRIAAQKLDVVRRPTGGRAVWHRAELTYAVAAPIATFGSLPETYLAIHTALADGLRALGASVSLAKKPIAPAALEDGACFAAPVGGEIVARGKKVVGSAQLRRGGAFLQHGSILLGGSQEIVNDVTRGAPPIGADISLAALLKHPAGLDQVTAAMARATQDAWPGEWRDGGGLIGRAIAHSAAHLERYRSAEWTWRR
ncbi:MAG: biotin/lipoate A/B protein ligase family protein [Gemmatimonadales bacterium]|jgi:lipoate-protein ligase A